MSLLYSWGHYDDWVKDDDACIKCLIRVKINKHHQVVGGTLSYSWFASGSVSLPIDFGWTLTLLWCIHNWTEMDIRTATGDSVPVHFVAETVLGGIYTKTIFHFFRSGFGFCLWLNNHGSVSDDFSLSEQFLSREILTPLRDGLAPRLFNV